MLLITEIDVICSEAVERKIPSRTSSEILRRDGWNNESLKGTLSERMETKLFLKELKLLRTC